MKSYKQFKQSYIKESKSFNDYPKIQFNSRSEYKDLTFKCINIRFENRYIKCDLFCIEKNSMVAYGTIEWITREFGDNMGMNIINREEIDNIHKNLKDIKEYLNDLFIEYKENDIEYSIEYSENLNLKFKISSKVKSDSRYWTCFDLNNCLDAIKHLISYLYSLDYKLSRSNFYILNRHRMEPYGYIMDPFQKDLQSVYYFLDHNIDYNLNVMILNFENTQIE